MAITNLEGKTIVVTRGKKGSRRWNKSLTVEGATVYNLPTITMSPVGPDEAITAAFKNLDSFDWIVFTSAIGVNYFLELVRQLGFGKVSDLHSRIAVIGSQTADEALKAGLSVAFQPSLSDSEHLSNELTPVADKSILLLRTTFASDDLPLDLRQKGAEVTDLRIYKTAIITGHDASFSQLLETSKVDYITFASPSAVQGFISRVNKEDLELAKNLKVVAIGPSVGRTLADSGFVNVHVANEASLEGVVQTLKDLARNE